MLSYLAPAGIAVAAYVLHYLPVRPFLVDGRRPISAAILAIVIGVLVRNLISLPPAAQAAAKQVAKKSLPLTVILLGASISFRNVAEIGLPVLAVILGAIAVALVTAVIAGRVLGTTRETALLLGAGTAICGNSAIAAAAPILEAHEDDLFLSVGVVNLLGLLLMLALPAAGGLLAMPDAAVGIWAGATIHAVPQAIAGGFAFSAKAGSVATLTKLVRVGMLAPLALLFVAIAARRRGKAESVNYLALVPSFLWGFLAIFLLNSFGVLGPAAKWLTEAGNLALTIAMAAVGLEVNLRSLVKVGGAALGAGLASCLAMSAAAYLLIRLLVQP